MHINRFTRALSLGLLVSFALIGATLSTSAHAAVPSHITFAGQVTALSSSHIEIDGVSYPLEADTVMAQQLASVHVGSRVEVELSAAAPGASLSTKASGNQSIVVSHSAAAMPSARVRRLRIL